PARIERNDLVVEPGKAAFVFRDQSRLKTALAIARDVDRQRTIVGEHGLLARAVAMIAALLGLDAARRIAQMMRQLAAPGAFDDGLLKAADRRLELLRRD